MNIILPEIPAGVLVLLAFFAPYAIGALNGALPFVTKAWQKKLVTVVVAILLAVIVLAFYYFMSGDIVPSWPVFIILSLLVTSASYALVTKTSATKVEQAVSTPDDGVGL